VKQSRDLRPVPCQAKRQRISYDQVKSEVQASDAELQTGMRKARVITIDGTALHLAVDTS
jgi:Sister chromatid cohesion protein Dcc1